MTFDGSEFMMQAEQTREPANSSLGWQPLCDEQSWCNTQVWMITWTCGNEQIEVKHKESV